MNEFIDVTDGYDSDDFADLTEQYMLFEEELGKEPVKTKQFIEKLIENGFNPESYCVNGFCLHCEGLESEEIVKIFKGLGYDGDL